ncbi:ATP-binding protein [Variovorax rhizosphaerae]|uniref:ATP-binding protein n=1 Tax=Variovorax rhizosphaerae TaxID=1836200 RepID=A0ABU8WW50_9BURK
MSDDDAVALVLPLGPYPGLRPFEMSEWPIFFGRERMVDAVVASLLKKHMVVVHGDSGAGKSSLIRAGVLPRLHQEQSLGGNRWRTCVALPGGGPLRQLAVALADLDGRAGDEAHVFALRRALNLGGRAPQALADLLLEGDDDHLCLLIDQFEELFEHARMAGGEAEARGLTDFLVAMAVTPPRGLYLAVTMRSEYLGACAHFPGLAEAVNKHQYLLPPMGTADLLRAIREPAGLYGGEVEPALAERLALDAQGPDGLPLVQHALMLMSPATPDTEGWRLTLDQYPADGLGGMLSRHADTVARAALSSGHPRLVEDLMRALTAKNAEGHAVRRQPRQTLAALAAVCGVTPGTLRPVVDAMRMDGVSFLTPRCTPADTQTLDDGQGIDIGHEALIRCWKALADPVQGWLEKEFRNGLVWRSLLVQADSFDRNVRNVLSPATTEERTNWLRRRTPAWADRYGGGWDRVQALMDASVAAHELQIQEEADARSREEQERLHEQELKAHLEVAVEKGRRDRLFKWAFAVSSLLFILAGFNAYSAYVDRNIAIRETANAAAAADKLQISLDETEAKRKVLESSLAVISSELDQLRHAYAAAPVSGETRKKIEEAQSSIAQQVNKLSYAASVSPRIYFHIAEESQRAAARALELRVEAGRVDNMPVVVPGIELIDAPPPENQLRCFKAEECKQYGNALLELVNARLASPKFILKDFSEKYGSSTSIRPLHFEIYFARGPISVSDNTR